MSARGEWLVWRLVSDKMPGVQPSNIFKTDARSAGTSEQQLRVLHTLLDDVLIATSG